jgi:uncharacterized protein YllA (UPF0747 family)
MFLQPELHQTGCSTSPRIMKKMLLPCTAFAAAPSYNSLWVRVSGFTALF